MSNNQSPKFLIVDDNEQVRHYLQRLLSQVFHLEADAVACPLEAIRLLHESNYCCLITDLEMPEMDGVELLQAIYESKPLLRTALLTGSEDAPRLESARALGAEVLVKPIDRYRLIEWIRSVLPR
jgi:CheY-like chemotaxis protein